MPRNNRSWAKKGQATCPELLQLLRLQIAGQSLTPLEYDKVPDVKCTWWFLFTRNKSNTIGFVSCKYKSSCMQAMYHTKYVWREKAELPKPARFRMSIPHPWRCWRWRRRSLGTGMTLSYLDVRKSGTGGEGCQSYSKALNASEIQLPLGDVEIF